MQLSNHEILVLIETALAGGVGVYVFIEVIKKIFGLKAGSVIHFLVIAATGLVAGAQYVIQLHAKIPPTVLGISGTSIYGFSQLVYRYSNYARSFFGKVNVSYNTPSTEGAVVNGTIASATTSSVVNAPTTTSPQPPTTNF